MAGDYIIIFDKFVVNYDTINDGWPLKKSKSEVS